MIKVRNGIHFFAFERNDDIEPDETQRIAFALLSIDFWGVSFGFRLFRVYADNWDIDDFFDRALLGVNLNHGRIIIDFLFLRLMVN